MNREGLTVMTIRASYCTVYEPPNFSFPVSGPFSVQWQRERYRFLSTTEQPSQA